MNEALKWFMIGAKSGFYPSSFNLGQIYFEGQGKEVDLKKAKEFFTLAAAQSQNDPVCVEYLEKIRELESMQK